MTTFALENPTFAYMHPCEMRPGMEIQTARGWKRIERVMEGYPRFTVVTEGDDWHQLTPLKRYGTR